MSWSYSGDPSSNDKDAVRFLVGDTEDASPLLRDEEIHYLLTLGGSVLFASVLAAETLAAKYAGQADSKVGELAIWSSKIAANYRELAKMLRVRYNALGAVLPVFGGISRNAETNLMADTDRISTFPRLGQFDNMPGTNFDLNKIFPDPPRGGQ